MKRLLALLLTACSVVSAQQTAGTTALDPTQVYTTGNIVQPTVAGTGTTPWVNGVYQDQLTCWAWGMQGNCGPNPSVRPGGYINYSFGYTDLYQIQAISSILPTTGLRVNGYNFGFTAKNGNGWDDARVDQLNAYVGFYGTDGKIKDYTSYDLNSKFDWTTFNYTKDFITPYADKDLSSVRYGFTGMDNNFWAGNYGPEIMNVSFSLKYSVDPCAVNVLSSPTCPGYLAALTSISGTSTTSTTTTAEATTISPVTGSDPLAPPPPPGSPPPPGGPAPVTNITTSTTNTATTSTTAQANPAPSSAPAKEGGPAQTSGTTLGLSVIAKNQQREQAIVTQAVQTAISTAAAAAATSQQEALSVASQAVANSTTSAATTNTSQSNGTGLQSILNTSQSAQTAGAKTESNNIGPQQGPQMLANSTVSAPGVAVQDIKTVSAYTLATQSLSTATAATEVAMPTTTTDFLTNKTNPLTEYVEAKSVISPETTRPMVPGPVVNTAVADNDLASGVSIARMAMAPVGYGDYLNFTLRDAAFYAPKEVYKNQRNVDNARVLRLMTNDSKHREMVEMQYAR